MDGTLLNGRDQMPRDFLIYSIKFTNSEFFLSLPAGGHTQPLPCSLKAAWTSLFLWLKTADVSSTATIWFIGTFLIQMPFLIFSGAAVGFPAPFRFSQVLKRPISDQISDDARKEIGRYYKKVQYIHDISEIDAPEAK